MVTRRCLEAHTIKKVLLKSNRKTNIKDTEIFKGVHTRQNIPIHFSLSWRRLL